MERSVLLQREFIGEYDKGKRVFDSCHMQFFEIANKKFEGLVIKNSKLFFCNFHNCELRNVRLENCSLYYVNFYTGKAYDLSVDNCDIEEMLFDVFYFERAAFKKCNIRWSGILNSNTKSVDISSSSQYKFFTDVSQVTQHDIEEATRLVMGDIERLDIGLRLKVKQLIRQDMDKYGLREPQEKKGPYEIKEDNKDAPLTYGEVKGLVEATFGNYGKQEIYKARKPYQTDRKYK